MQRSLSSTRPRIKRLLKHFKLKERNKTVVTLSFIWLEDNFIYAQWEWTSFWNISSPFYVGQSTKKAVYAEPHRLAADIKMHMFACIRFCSIVNWQKVRAVLCVEARQAVSSVFVEWRSELSSGYNRHTVAVMCSMTESKSTVANTIHCCLLGFCLTRAK